MSFKVFIDTEFTDFIAPKLISIGFVAATGEEFYAELPYDIKECSPFVKETVLPLLGYVPNAYVTKDDLYNKMTDWLRLIRPIDEDIEICYDYQTDWDLFYGVLDGRVPPWCKRRLVRINELLRYEYHKKKHLPEHHALYDAQANSYAFRERPNVAS